MKILRDFAIVWLCLLAGRWLAAFLPFSFPASILGMLVLFFLLTAGFLPLKQIKKGCSLLLKYMGLLFIPAGVGIIEYSDLLTQFWPALLLSTIAGSFAVMLVTGHIFQRLDK